MTATRTKMVAPKSIPELAADLDAGLRRLKLATVRRNAPEVLLTAKTQRWTPEEVLRTLIEAELTARDASNAANRLKAAAFPVVKTLDGFDVTASSIPQATFDYLSSLEWIRAQHNLTLIGPPVISGWFGHCNNVINEAPVPDSISLLQRYQQGSNDDHVTGFVRRLEGVVVRV